MIRRVKGGEEGGKEGGRKGGENMKYYSLQSLFIYIIEMFFQENLYCFYCTQDEMEVDSRKYWKLDFINFFFLILILCLFIIVIF